jgi:N-acylglucosamine-6-phosphate 2-epimerase
MIKINKISDSKIGEYMNSNLISNLKHGLIVSCQALEQEPLYGSDVMLSMAMAAQQGGAVGIRANTPKDIAAIKSKCSLPVIGLYKKHYPDSDVYITPTLLEVKEIVEAGADLVAIDATMLARPNGILLEEFVFSIRNNFPDTLLVADISTYEEGVVAMDLGVDLVSTTMSGYTPHSLQQELPDIALVARLSSIGKTPVLAEGRIWTPEQCVACMEAGAHAVVVGTAITRPQEITKRFVKSIHDSLNLTGAYKDI